MLFGCGPVHESASVPGFGCCADNASVASGAAAGGDAIMSVARGDRKLDHWLVDASAHGACTPHLRRT